MCFPDFLSQLIVFNAERATPIRPALTPPRCLTTITTTTVVSIQTAVVDGSRERTDTGGERRDKVMEQQDITKEQQGTAKADTLRCCRDHHQTDCRPRNSHFTVCNRHILPRNTPIVPRIHIIQHPGRVCGRRRTFAAVLCPVLVHLLARLRPTRRGGVYGTTLSWALSSGRHYR